LQVIRLNIMWFAWAGLWGKLGLRSCRYDLNLGDDFNFNSTYPDKI
jgi:hypothetical protein